jgi:6-phospho-beta-glucosidase
VAQKLVFLGGASPFIPSTFQAIVENKEVLAGSEVCLMDPNPARLPTLARLGEQMARRAGFELKVTYSSDPRQAIDGATFVFPGYRVGGVKALAQDFSIPGHYGICGDETAGPGGTFMAQCTIPATVGYCRIIEELAPDAWAISYVNPTNFVADAVRRVTKTKFIAICDCFPGFVHGIARQFGVADDQVQARAMGVNHLTWLTEARVDGKDVYPELREKLRRVSLERGPDLDFSDRIADAYGYLLVCPSHPRMMWEHDEVMAQHQARWDGAEALQRHVDRMTDVWEYVDALIDGAPFDDSKPHMRMYHARHAIGLAVSIISNDGREWGGMNFPNNGAIGNLPRGAIVEGQCVVDARGPTPIALGDLPKAVLGQTQAYLAWQDLTVDAALAGDKKLLYQALLAVPYLHDMKAAKQIMDDLLVAHADLMPQFQEKPLVAV